MFSLLSRFTRSPDAVAAAPTSLAQVALTLADGSPLTGLDGKVVLFVNVASKCGYTRQYAGLEELYTRYKDRGLVIVGTPCNQFGGQEPGTESEIVSFCSLNYGVDFPILQKAKVNGAERAPLYHWLIDSTGGAKIGWNFEKFLVNRAGGVVARWPSRVEPNAPELVAAVEAALGAS